MRRSGVGELANRVRRRVEERVDQALTLVRWKWRPPVAEPRFDGDPRFALLTVNRSTTRYLKLLLLTLLEQSALSRVRRIIVCDNDSRDGGMDFLRRLSAAVPDIHVVARPALALGHSHAQGMRAAIQIRNRVEAGLPGPARSNLLLFIDPDVVFRNRDALADLGDVFREGDAAAAGELRDDLYPYPEAQASFLAVRSDWCARADVWPWVNHGAPSYWLQRSIWRAGGRIAHFPSNQGGYILHRGRAAIAAIAHSAPLSSYATVPALPHFMGVPDGPAIWAAIEAQHEALLAPAAEASLLARLVAAWSSRAPGPPG
jgi:hypothetical protein